MIPKGKEDAPPEFIFVGGSALKGRTGVIRSSLARRALSDRRARLHQDASERLDSMLKEGQSSICDCLRSQADSANSSTPSRQEGPSYRAIRSKGDTSTRDPQLYCRACGRSLVPASVSNRQRSSPIPPPQTFASGNRNPIIPFDPELAAVRVDEVLNFAATAIWPSFRLSDHAPSCYRSWIFPYTDKLKVYTTLWSASYHQDILRFSAGASPCLDSREQLYLRGLVLKSLREEVGRAAYLSSPDGLVMSVLFLAVNVAHRTGLRRDLNPFSPPFTELHGLHNYGSRQYHPWHWDIVHTIIDRFGGISSLKAHGLAWLLSIADVMNAVNTLQKPMYPMLDIQGKVLDLEPPLCLFPVKPPGEDDSLYPPGSAFHQLLSLCPPVKPEIVSVFLHLGQLASVLQYYFESVETTTPTILDSLGDCRNQVHHRLFCLPDETDDSTLFITSRSKTDPADLEHSTQIYLACRLAALLYAIHVTFPTPRIAPQQKQLSTALNLKLRWLVERDASNPLLLWPMFILTLSCGNKASPEWLPHLRRMCANLSVNTSAKLLRLLRSFAWVDAAFPDFDNSILPTLLVT
ncbi:hypothetical protein BDV12DRAFT_169734 [Aspergillus spectabilis]